MTYLIIENSSGICHMQHNNSSSHQTHSLKNIPNIQTVYSWDIFSDTQISKNIDLSVLRYNGSGIPVEIRAFFNVDTLHPGGKQPLILCYEGIDYNAYIEMENDHYLNRIPRTRIFWDKKLGEMIKEFCCKFPDINYELRFIKSQIQKNYYFVKLVESISIVDTQQILLHNSTSSGGVTVENKYSTSILPQNIQDVPENRPSLENNDCIKPTPSELEDEKKSDISYDTQRVYSQHNNIVASAQSSHILPNITQNKTDQLEEEICLTVLEEFFPYGIDIENKLQIQKYFACYSQHCQAHPENMVRQNPNRLLQQIQTYAVQCGENLWMAPKSFGVPEELCNSIITTIKTLFQEDEIIVSLDEIYNQYKPQLSETEICDGVVLSNYISRYINENYYCIPPYISPYRISEWPDILTHKILEKIESYGEVVEYEQLIHDIPHIPPEAINQVLRLPEIIGGKRNSYIHVHCLDITEKDIEQLYQLIKTHINGGVLTTSHLFNLYSKENPEFFERNHISEIKTLTDITRYYFPDEFSYSRGKISLKGISTQSATEQMINYLGSSPKFTYQDLERYKAQHHLNIAVMGVLYPLLTKHRYLRLNEEEFISSDHFPVSQEIIDEVSVLLEKELSSGYFCSDSIRSYLPYPFVNQYPITPYLLESLVRLYGDQFRPKLRILDYYTGGKKPRGIILRADLHIQNHDDLLIDAMRKRNRTLPFEDANDALQYLKEAKYIDREPRGGIERLYRMALE